MRGSFRSMTVAVLVAFGLLVVAASSGAAVTPSRDADAVAAAIPAAGMSIGAASFLAIPPTGNPAGVSDSPIAPFPADGPTYAVLSTGDVTLSGTLHVYAVMRSHTVTRLGGSDMRDSTGAALAGFWRR